MRTCKKSILLQNNGEKERQVIYSRCRCRAYPACRAVFLSFFLPLSSSRVVLLHLFIPILFPYFLLVHPYLKYFFVKKICTQYKNSFQPCLYSSQCAIYLLKYTDCVHSTGHNVCSQLCLSRGIGKEEHLVRKQAVTHILRMSMYAN